MSNTTKKEVVQTEIGDINVCNVEINKADLIKHENDEYSIELHFNNWTNDAIFEDEEVKIAFENLCKSITDCMFRNIVLKNKQEA